MSFATNIKNEICKNYGNKTENIAELAAIARNSYNKSLSLLEIKSEKMFVCRHIYNLFKETYGLSVKIDYRGNSRNRLYYVNIPSKIDIILKDLSVLDEVGNYIDKVKDYILDSEDEKRAYLRGLFLRTGSINDPKTSMYHLEFLIDYYEEALFVSDLLNEFSLSSKVIERDKGFMVYIKKAEKIGDFLRIIGASNAVMYYEDIRIYRDHKNMTNRLNNCEQATIDKIIISANKQIEEIELIKSKLEDDMIDDKLLVVMEYRLKYPDVSLQELSEIISIETGKLISKSGLNHRFRKIKEIVSKL